MSHSRTSRSTALVRRSAFLFFHISSRFHAQANPEPNRVGREATFYTRPLASFLSFSQRTRSARGRCLGRVSLVSNYDGSGTLLNRYVSGARRDEVLIQIAGSTLTFDHMDRLGSTIAQTNASGAVLNKYSYSPFGETPSLAGATFGFTGQRYDSEIRLYNYKARYYAPAIGRFLQPDPIGYAAGDMNLYSYVGNDAVNLTDSMGLLPGQGGNNNLNAPWPWQNGQSWTVSPTTPAGNGEQPILIAKADNPALPPAPKPRRYTSSQRA